MMSTVRLSRRAMLGAVFTFAFVVIGLLALKDLNDKLGVMTATNAGYQKMMDSQSEAIQKLGRELENSWQGHKSDVDEFTRKETEYKAKFGKMEEELRNGSSTLKERLSKARDELESMRAERDGEIDRADERHRTLEKANADMRAAKDAAESDLGEAKRELELCARKQAAAAAGNNATAAVSPEQQQQIRMPNASSTLRRSKSRSTSPAAAAAAADGAVKAEAPVAAEPPLAAAEAEEQRLPPKGENLDQMVDHVHQDNPDLPGPLETGRLDRDFQRQEEENEADDAVDGRLYERNGAAAAAAAAAGPKGFSNNEEEEDDFNDAAAANNRVVQFGGGGEFYDGGRLHQNPRMLGIPHRNQEVQLSPEETAMRGRSRYGGL